MFVRSSTTGYRLRLHLQAEGQNQEEPEPQVARRITGEQPGTGQAVSLGSLMYRFSFRVIIIVMNRSFHSFRLFFWARTKRLSPAPPHSCHCHPPLHNPYIHHKPCFTSRSRLVFNLFTSSLGVPLAGDPARRSFRPSLSDS